MKRIALLAFAMFLATVGYCNASEAQKLAAAATGPDPAVALPAPDRSTGARMAPLPAQPVKSRVTTHRHRHFTSKSKRHYRGGFRECPGYTMSRHARLRVNRTVERLLARGYDDPLSQPAYWRAKRAERATYPAVGRCNMAWLRHVSIYSHKRRY